MAYSYGDETVTAGGVVSPEATSDHEEKEQCIKMHEIIAQYKLDGEFRYGLKLTLGNQSCKHARSIRNPLGKLPYIYKDGVRMKHNHFAMFSRLSAV